IWEWASNDKGSDPDVVMACCGDVPTMETLAAVELLNRHLPELKVRVINIVNLMKLQSPSEHPHGLSDREFDALFTRDKPIICACNGSWCSIPRWASGGTNPRNLTWQASKKGGPPPPPSERWGSTAWAAFPRGEPRTTQWRQWGPAAPNSSRRSRR